MAFIRLRTPARAAAWLLGALLSWQAAAQAGEAPVRAERYMISTANPLAARAGLEILRAGGSAVDAAIAAQMVLNLVEPQSSGIGGGGFMLHYDAQSRSVAAYDGRETAPHQKRRGVIIH